MQKVHNLACIEVNSSYYEDKINVESGYILGWELNYT